MFLLDEGLKGPVTDGPHGMVGDSRDEDGERNADHSAEGADEGIPRRRGAVFRGGAECHGQSILQGTMS